MSTNLRPTDQAAVADVLAERLRQEAKWGPQNHGALVWLMVLGEEVGELAEEFLHQGLVADTRMVNAAERLAVAGKACKDILEWRAEHGRPHDSTRETVEARAELTQVAAVALAWIECLKRGRQ